MFINRKMRNLNKPGLHVVDFSLIWQFNDISYCKVLLYLVALTVLATAPIVYLLYVLHLSYI